MDWQRGRAKNPRCRGGWVRVAFVRLVVDLTVCQGYAQCCFLAPEAFRLSGEEALLYDPAPDDSQRERVLRAVAACPVRAIHIQEGGE